MEEGENEPKVLGLALTVSSHLLAEFLPTAISGKNLDQRVQPLHFSGVAFSPMGQLSGYHAAFRKFTRHPGVA